MNGGVGEKSTFLHTGLSFLSAALLQHHWEQTGGTWRELVYSTAKEAQLGV